ncbi:ADP-ribosylglycohydrolase family protein [Nocardioides zhouii]|uniref:ADP-ribosylglycohydrolase family protein n=1 Tax=Nocardioides zhouii TaxID=1168729 RepID=A0A4V1RPT7_9ACTN|nr:ADP-ribosylglycohydrolase family protein [Nocardioides zhouii]RYC10497.1 ADP-ribosylglycohydrolase family protein [Nocardioides zhouii]
MLHLTPAQVDRACGALLASAVGDALGAGYEFGSATYTAWPEMIGGGLGGFEPGEWTDDTAQAVAIARVAATGADLRTTEALDAIADGFGAWFAGFPPDVGVQTAAVLRRAGAPANAARMAAAAAEVHEQNGGRSAGNGSLMRTAPVALAHLDDPGALVEAAMAISALTHHDPVAGEGAALWCLMIRHTVLHGELPTPDEVVPLLGSTGTDWQAILTDAETKPPSTFTQNGWVVGALQAAWSAIAHTEIPKVMPCRHLQCSLATAIGIGHDTDTVAAIAGALLGARWGASAVPLEWQERLHGWGARSGVDLIAMATLTVRGGQPDNAGWPSTDWVYYSDWDVAGTCVSHPLVSGVWIGDSGALDRLPEEIDAVVSLCRVGTAQPAAAAVRLAARILDTTPEDNPNIEFAIDDVARTVLRLRDEGRAVFLHCVTGQSRTPVVAARVAVLAGHPLAESLSAVVDALPAARPRRFLVDALVRLERLGPDRIDESGTTTGGQA